MALATYADLKTAVATKVSRSDLTANIVDAIRLVHQRLMRVLRVREMETIDAAFSINAETVSLPTLWLETRKMYLTSVGGSRVDLQYVSPDKILEYNLSASTDTPKFFSVIADKFIFSPIPDATYTATHIYYTKLAQMSADSDHNWILDDHADLYLYGACLETMIDIQNDPRIPMWQSYYDRALEELTRQSQRARSGPAMQTRPG